MMLLVILATALVAAPFVEDVLLTPSTNPRTGGRLYMTLDTAPQSFNFYGTLDNAAYTVMGQMLSGLIDEHPVTSELRPGLAESWTVSEDGKEVVFHLRDVKWSDDTPFTADDVIFTMENFVMNRFAEGNSIARFTIGGELVKWEKVDERNVKAILPEPYAAFYRVLAHAYIYPKHIHEGTFNAEDRGSVNKVWLTNSPVEKFVGTGPYIIEQYITDQKVIMRRNPNFWKVDVYGNQLPYFGKVEYLIVRDSQVKLAMFMSGQIDYMPVDGRDFPNLKQRELAGGPFKIFLAEPTQPTPSPVHISFNWDTANPQLAELFKNKDFRAAVEFVVDRDRIIDEVYNGLAVYGGVPVLPANRDFYNPNIEDIRRSYNPTEAKKLLDNVGIIDRNRDGYRQFSDGKRVEIVILASNSQVDQDIAYILSQDLEDVGIKVHLSILEPGLTGQRFGAGDFEMGIRAFGNQPDPQLRKAIWQPGTHLYYWHRTSRNPDTNEPIFENMQDWELRVFELFELGQVEMDHSIRRTYYDEWQEIYAEYLPVIFVCKGMNLSAANIFLGNVEQHASGLVSFATWTAFRK
jgi:peptide/nickel transport system substrate-binding protein